MALGQFVDERYFERFSETTATRTLELDPAEFRQLYNREAFAFHHHLCDEPLLQFEELFKLCKRLPENSIKFRRGKVPVDINFDTSLAQNREGLTLDSVIEHFDENESYLAIYNPETDPEYRDLIERILSEISRNILDVDSPITWYSTYIFMSTAQSVTPYHMDREMNFLFQIQGEKYAKLWSRFDERVMTSAERDTLLTDEGKKRPAYRQALERLSKNFELRPGIGLHHPFIAPHLISTKSDRSVTLAITYRTELSDVWSDAHNFNYYLRKAGLTPGPVGVDRKIDQRKATVMRCARKCLKPIRDLIK